MNTEAIWKESNAKLKQFILKRIPDEGTAEDILQDVYVKIHRQLLTLQDNSKLHSWIYQTTRNAIIDYYRSQKPRGELPEALFAHEDSADVVDELAPCIQGMVENLPEAYREALKLTEYQGLTRKEMAEKFGISLSAAKSRAQRARGKLKEILLACCHFELDRRGRVIGYEPRSGSCSGGRSSF